MRKIVYTMFIIMLLFSCSILLVSCEAITAQNITNTGSTLGKNGGLGIHDNFKENRNLWDDPGKNYNTRDKAQSNK